MPRTTKQNIKTGPSIPHWMFGITYSCVILAVLLVGVKFALHGQLYRSLFMNDTYQAVTLTNGQTFFGQLDQYGPGTYLLNDVYYLQSTPTTTTSDETAVDTTSPNSGLQLVRLDDDIHQPLNHIVINKGEVVYWQNLNPASPIMDAIAKGNLEN